MPVKKGEACPGTGKPPKIITMSAKGNFSGTGICSLCANECSLTRAGNMFTHKAREESDERN